MKPSEHVPVLLEEVIEYIEPQVRKHIVDATASGGGHLLTIAQRFPETQLLGLEWDPVIAESLKQKTESLQLQDRVTIINDSYANLTEVISQNRFSPDAFLFDLGLSSWHYEGSNRGFSFQRDELLDMRFNPETTKDSAADIVNTQDPREIERILREYGEERFAGDIAKNIIRHRQQKPIVTSSDLVAIVEEAVPEWYKRKKIHCATKTFQALRIAVNGELENVRQGITQALDALGTGGRLLVIAFHGGEDIIVKNFFKEKAKEGSVKLITKKPIQAAWPERKANPRARSAKLRIIEKQ